MLPDGPLLRTEAATIVKGSLMGRRRPVGRGGRRATVWLSRWSRNANLEH